MPRALDAEAAASTAEAASASDAASAANTAGAADAADAADVPSHRAAELPSRQAAERPSRQNEKPTAGAARRPLNKHASNAGVASKDTVKKLTSPSLLFSSSIALEDRSAQKDRTPAMPLTAHSPLHRCGQWPFDHEGRSIHQVRDLGAAHFFLLPPPPSTGRAQGAHTALLFVVPPAGVAGVDGALIKQLLAFSKTKAALVMDAFAPRARGCMSGVGE